MDFKNFVVILVLLGSICVAKELGHLSNPLERLEIPKLEKSAEADWVGTRYQVSVRLRAADFSFGAGHICGGSLIKRNAVLTAAHCIWNAFTNSFRNASEFSVVVGNVDRTKRDNNTLVFRVNEMSIREGFNAYTFEEDMAILFLDRSVPKNYTRAHPIELNTERNLTAGTTCQVSGWGHTETGNLATKLLLTDAKLINRTECARSYGDHLRDGMLCADYMDGVRDFCTGDSGGPLVCGGSLVGVVSFDVGCAQPGYPGVHAEVAAFVDWIRDETNHFYEDGPTSGTWIVLPNLIWMMWALVVGVWNV